MVVRPAWTGSITFGLVAVPVKLYPAVESHSGPVLNQVHQEDGSRIRLKKYCEAENREVDLGEIAKGWEPGDGRVVILTEEDLDTLPVPSKRIIDVLAFVPETGVINPLAYDTPYYVGLGDKAPAKPYKLLIEAMKGSGLVAVTKVTMRSRESLAVLRVVDDLLVLQTIRWPDEIRPATEIKAAAADEPVRPQEIKMALSLAADLSEDYDLDSERDAYVTALNELVTAKARGGELPADIEAPEPAVPVVDLMAALKDSIAKSHAAREAAHAPDKETAAKRAPKKKVS